MFIQKHPCTADGHSWPCDIRMVSPIFSIGLVRGSSAAPYTWPDTLDQGGKTPNRQPDVGDAGRLESWYAWCLLCCYDYLRLYDKARIEEKRREEVLL